MFHWQVFLMYKSIKAFSSFHLFSTTTTLVFSLSLLFIYLCHLCTQLDYPHPSIHITANTSTINFSTRPRSSWRRIWPERTSTPSSPIVKVNPNTKKTRGKEPKLKPSPNKINPSIDDISECVDCHLHSFIWITFVLYMLMIHITKYFVDRLRWSLRWNLKEMLNHNKYAAK